MSPLFKFRFDISDSSSISGSYTHPRTKSHYYLGQLIFNWQRYIIKLEKKPYDQLSTTEIKRSSIEQRCISKILPTDSSRRTIATSW